VVIVRFVLLDFIFFDRKHLLFILIYTATLSFQIFLEK
jgi:hypothetical protein